MVFLTAVLALSLSCQKVSEVEAVDDSFKKYGQEFKGKIAKSYKDSEEWWPDTPKPPAGTPNVIIFLLDDTGFAHYGSFGGQQFSHHRAMLALPCSHYGRAQPSPHWLGVAFANGHGFPWLQCVCT
jgi:hypothetical protein